VPNSINGAKQHKQRQMAQMMPNGVKTVQTASKGANANDAKQQTNGVKRCKWRQTAQTALNNMKRCQDGANSIKRHV
jgi:hypothetical protein